MKISASLKSMFRQPLKTIIFILLIALAAFTFAIRAFEGLIVNREITRLEAAYQTIGRLIPTEDWQWEITADAERLLTNSSLVHYTDRLQVIPGVMDHVYTPDIDGRSPYPNQLFVYGTLVHKGYRELEPLLAEFDPDEYHEFFTVLSFAPHLTLYYFDVLVDTVAAALPEYATEGETIRFHFVDYRGEQRQLYEQAQIGERYFIGGQFGRILLIYRTIPNFRHLPPTLLRESFRLDLLLRPLTEENLYFYPAPAGTVVETPEVMEQVEILRQNIHTIFLRPTKDLRAFSETMSSMTLVTGRLLDDADHENQNQVAVIRAEFAALRGLAVGDSITLTMHERPFAKEYIIPDAMRSFPIPHIGTRYTVADFRNQAAAGIYSGTGVVTTRQYGYYAFITNLMSFENTSEKHRHLHDLAICYGCFAAYTKSLLYYDLREGPFLDGIEYDGFLHIDLRGLDEIMNLEMATGYITDAQSDHNWREAATKEVTLEIVGTYTASDRLHNTLTVSHNHVFVPNSIIPSSWHQDVLYRHFSFALNSPADEERFILRYQQQLEEMGFFPVFSENDWGSFAATVRPIQNGILMGVATFTVLVLAVLYLTVFLYFHQRKREFAIARALGMKKSQAIWELSLPILLIGGVGLLLGVIPGWHLALALAENTLGNIEEALFRQPPLTWLFLLIALLFGLVMVCVVVEVRKLAQLSELELLQGKVASKVKQRGVKQVKPNLVPLLDATASACFQDVPLNLTKLEKELPKKGIGAGYLMRVIPRQMMRRLVKSLLSVAVPLGFLIALSWMRVSIRENIQQVNWLYDNTVVTGTLLVNPASATTQVETFPLSILRAILRVEFVEGDDLEERLATAFVAAHHAEAQHEMRPILMSAEELAASRMVSYEAAWASGLANALGVSRLDLFESFHGVEFEIEYLDGFGDQIFTNSDHVEPMMLVSKPVMEHLWQHHGISLGDQMGLASGLLDAFFPGDVAFYKIVGTFAASDLDVQFIIPLSHLQNHLRYRLEYSRAVFELNPDLNRELGGFRQETASILERRVNPPLFFALDDHLLQEVIVPLEQSITLMQTLYPIILALSGLIAAGLTALLLLPLMKEVATMRALGATRKLVMLMLILEQQSLCLLGLGVGGFISILAFGWVNFLGALLYLLGCLSAAIVFSIILVKRKPLELLQVKE